MIRWRMLFHRAAHLFDEVIFPTGVKCLLCPNNPEHAFLCPDCAKALNALRLPVSEGPNRACWQYNGAARELVIQLKHGCIAACADVMARGMAEIVCDMHLPENTVCTWITMPPKRLRDRGIDHGRTLCEAVAARSGLACRQLMERVGRVHTQQGLNREGRIRNLQGSFLCNERLNHPVLLIDDVMTTGATTQLCRELLMRQGATHVYVLTATRVASGSD